MSRQVQVLLPYDDENKRQAKRILKELQGLEVVFGLAAFEGKGCLLITFRTSARASGKLIHALQKFGVGVDGYGFIDILLLQSTTPPVQPPRRPFLRRFKVGDRASIEEMMVTVKGNNHIHFNFLLFVVCASLIASIGLATGSATVIIAAMLISPLMGPILALAFGCVTLDWRLVSRGLLNESIGFLLALSIGSAWGAATCYFVDMWDTDEQLGRGSVWASVGGVGIALASGAAAAAGTCGGETSSLIGVAISTSILPPITNGGMYIVRGLFQLGLIDGSWSDSLEVGGYSLMLFVVNAVCIVLSAILVFWLKGVRPLKKVKPAPVDDIEARLDAEGYKLESDSDELGSNSDELEWYDPRVPPSDWPECHHKVPLHLDQLLMRTIHHGRHRDKRDKELRRTQSAKEFSSPITEAPAQQPTHARAFSEGQPTPTSDSDV